MKSFRSILIDLALLATAGCIFPDHRNCGEDLEPLRPCPPKGRSGGLGRAKFTGDQRQVKSH
jgi:hypothetical protein